MDGSVTMLIISLLVLIIDIYIVLLFVRMFIAEYERYDRTFDVIFQATDPIMVPLTTSLRLQTVQIAPLLVIAVLLMLKGMIVGSIPGALQSFLSMLLRIYVLTIIITAAFREAYLNPIVNFGQRLVRPVRNLALHISPHPMTVNVLAVGFLIIAHTIALLILYNVAGRGGDDLLLAKSAFIYTLGLIVDLTWFFVIVLFLYVVLSWFSPDPHNAIVQLLTIITVPMLEPLRRVIPPIAGMIDPSPILAMLALQVGNAVLHSFLSAL